jgi:hypothetical protein
MVIVGYDDKRSAFRIINSWGQTWGEGGYGWVDYSAMTERGREYYVMNVPLVRPDPFPQPVPEPEPPAPSPQPEPHKPITPSKDIIHDQVQKIISVVECGKVLPELNQKGNLTLKGFIELTLYIWMTLHSVLSPIPLLKLLPLSYLTRDPWCNIMIIIRSKELGFFKLVFL